MSKKKGLLETESIMRAFAVTLEDVLPGIGFALLTFDFNVDDGVGNYISNGNRDDIIKALKEFVTRLEKKETIPACEGQG